MEEIKEPNNINFTDIRIDLDHNRLAVNYPGRQDNPILTDREHYVYQSLKLKKEMINRQAKDKEGKNKNYLGLEKATGLTPNDPNAEFGDSFLKDLFEKNNEEKCKFLICVTMFNEEYENLKNTLSGIIDNIETFQKQGVDPKNIACIIIVDGIKPFSETYNKTPSYFRKFFSFDDIKRFKNEPRCIDPDHISKKDLDECNYASPDDNDEFAHCFIHQHELNDGINNLKLIFCVKQKNKRKLNTHLWFFGGFCEMIQPEFVMLIDVGTKPLAHSLYYLYHTMEIDEQVAGCCGEILPMESDLWKIVVPAQCVEYKFAHMLDKALESIFGYITVLPGAFSAYKWKALQGEPLWEHYFKSICKAEEMTAYYSNIYLAEDRVLCLSLVAQEGQKYILRYVRNSKAETDVPKSISELMAQRRRWINGSWFALIDTVKNCNKIYKSNHHCFRKCVFTFQMVYYIINLIYTWFLVGLFCLAFCITIFKNFDGKENESTGTVLIVIYIALLLTILITSLGVKPSRIEDFYKAIAVLMGMYQAYITYLTVSFMIAMDYSRYSYIVILSIGGAASLFAFVVLLNCEIVTVAKGVLYYIFLIPTYVNIFSIYSICNLHDCSWGNRPDQMTKEELEKVEEFEKFRTHLLIPWVLSNAGVTYIAYWVYKMDNDISFWIITIITATGIFIILLRGIFGIIYVIHNRIFLKKISNNRNEFGDEEGDTTIVYEKKRYWID